MAKLHFRDSSCFPHLAGLYVKAYDPTTDQQKYFYTPTLVQTIFFDEEGIAHRNSLDGDYCEEIKVDGDTKVKVFDSTLEGASEVRAFTISADGAVLDGRILNAADTPVYDGTEDYKLTFSDIDMH